MADLRHCSLGHRWILTEPLREHVADGRFVELRSKSGAEKKGEIETCFTALYGKLLLHLQGKEVTSETDLAMRQISKFVGLLAEKYRMYKNGELDLD